MLEARPWVTVGSCCLIYLGCGGQTERDHEQASSSGGAGGTAVMATGGGSGTGGSAGFSGSGVQPCGLSSSYPIRIMPGATCSTTSSSACRCDDAPDPECQSMARCVPNALVGGASGTWQVTTADCAPPPPTPCPDSIDQAQDESCNPEGTKCSFPGDVACYCVRPSRVDRESAYCGFSEPTRWYCGEFDHQAQCPHGVPEIGSPCDADIECGFACFNSLSRTCSNGVWQEGQVHGECI